MTKHDINAIREDIKNLSNADFEKKYPGMKKDAIQHLNDADLENVAGGLTISGGGIATTSAKGTGTLPVFK